MHVQSINRGVLREEERYDRRMEESVRIAPAIIVRAERDKTIDETIVRV